MEWLRNKRGEGRDICSNRLLMTSRYVSCRLLGRGLMWMAKSQGRIGIAFA